MLDLDRYVNNSIEVKIAGEIYDILEPTLAVNMEVNRIEEDLTEENLFEKRVDVAKLFLDHKPAGKDFFKERDHCNSIRGNYTAFGRDFYHENKGRE